LTLKLLVVEQFGLAVATTTTTTTTAEQQRRFLSALYVAALLLLLSWQKLLRHGICSSQAGRNARGKSNTKLLSSQTKAPMNFAGAGFVDLPHGREYDSNHILLPA
jgi:hypothetical protein